MTLIQFADNAQADLSLRCPLTESMNAVVYVDEQRILRSDCTDAYADLDLCCLHKGPFRALCIKYNYDGQPSRGTKRRRD